MGCGSVKLLCRHTYPVFYRLMLQELVESVKKLLPGKASDPEQVENTAYKLCNDNTSTPVVIVMVIVAVNTDSNS